MSGSIIVERQNWPVSLVSWWCFFAFARDITPERVQLSALDVIVLEQDVFEDFGVLGGLAQPFEDGILLETLGAVEAADAHAFGQERQRLEDVLLVGSFAVEERAVVLIEGFAEVEAVFEEYSTSRVRQWGAH
jgi:hypothetical protein